MGSSGCGRTYFFLTIVQFSVPWVQSRLLQIVLDADLNAMFYTERQGSHMEVCNVGVRTLTKLEFSFIVKESEIGMALLHSRAAALLQCCGGSGQLCVLAPK